MLKTRALLAALVLAAAATPLPAQGCGRCHGQGTVPCKQKNHDRERVCRTTLEHRCDAIWGARCCRGLEKVLCERCEDPVARMELEQALKARRSWVERMREVEKKAGIRMSHVRTEHFVLHYSIRRFKYGLKRYNRIQGAHHFADLVEEAASRFEEVCGNISRPRHTLFLVPSEDQNMAVTLTFMGVGHKVAFKLYSHACKVSCWPRPPELRRGEMFRSHVVHNATHCMVQSTHGFKQDFAPWFDAGMAHWIEKDVTDLITTFCFEEVNTKDRWKSIDWRKPIYNEVRRRDDVSLAELSSMVMDGMEHRHHAYAWSFVDFLINRHPEEFKTFFRELKRTNETRTALDKALGWSSNSFQDNWRRYVLAEYGIN